jgi:hypothetical protein
MRKRAYLFTRDALWSKVAQEYLGVFAQARQCSQRQPTRRFRARAVLPVSAALPEISLHHLRRMTDSTGLLQHARFNIPDRAFGYCTDDNARALLLTVSAQDLLPADEELASMRACYLGFLAHALNPDTARFRNFMSYERQWQESEGSEDSQGRALLALGVTAARAPEEAQQAAAAALFNQALPKAKTFISPRAWAMTLIGINAYREKFTGDSGAKRMAKLLATRLLRNFHRNATEDWHWFEDVLTYDNGKLAEALLLTGSSLADKRMISTGIQALEWLTKVQIRNGRFVPIGNDGWYRRDGHRARFDQQPIEAQSMIEAYLAAHRVTGDNRWASLAHQVFQWYLGENDLNIPLYDRQTGACYDGLGPGGPNLNQGAESTLAWLLALTDLHKLRAAIPAQPPGQPEAMRGESVPRTRSYGQA